MDSARINTRLVSHSGFLIEDPRLWEYERLTIYRNPRLRAKDANSSALVDEDGLVVSKSRELDDDGDGDGRSGKLWGRWSDGESIGLAGRCVCSQNQTLSISDNPLLCLCEALSLLEYASDRARLDSKNTTMQTKPIWTFSIPFHPCHLLCFHVHRLCRSHSWIPPSLL